MLWPHIGIRMYLLRRYLRFRCWTTKREKAFLMAPGELLQPLPAQKHITLCLHCNLCQARSKSRSSFSCCAPALQPPTPNF